MAEGNPLWNHNEIRISPGQESYRLIHLIIGAQSRIIILLIRVLKRMKGNRPLQPTSKPKRRMDSCWLQEIIIPAVTSFSWWNNRLPPVCLSGHWFHPDKRLQASIVGTGTGWKVNSDAGPTLWIPCPLKRRDPEVMSLRALASIFLIHSM